MSISSLRVTLIALVVGAGLALAGNAQAATLDLSGLGLMNDPQGENGNSQGEDGNSQGENQISNVINPSSRFTPAVMNPSDVDPPEASADPPGASAVPEPSMWLMMLLGFAGLGFAFRKSRRKVSFA